MMMMNKQKMKRNAWGEITNSEFEKKSWTMHFLINKIYQGMEGNEVAMIFLVLRKKKTIESAISVHGLNWLNCFIVIIIANGDHHSRGMYSLYVIRK